MILAIILHLIGYVPFVGHHTDGRLFCNAACEVVETGYRTQGPVSIPYPGSGLTVRAA